MTDSTLDVPLDAQTTAEASLKGLRDAVARYRSYEQEEAEGNQFDAPVPTSPEEWDAVTGNEARLVALRSAAADAAMHYAHDLDRLLSAGGHLPEAWRNARR